MSSNPSHSPRHVSSVCVCVCLSLSRTALSPPTFHQLAKMRAGMSKKLSATEAEGTCTSETSACGGVASPEAFEMVSAKDLVPDAVADKEGPATDGAELKVAVAQE